MRLRISFVLLFAVFSLSLAADTITVVSSSNAIFQPLRIYDVLGKTIR